MKVILAEDVKKLGVKGDIVEVSGQELFIAKKTCNRCQRRKYKYC